MTVVVVLLPVLAACGDGSGDSTATDALDGREFLSQSVDGRSLVPDTQIRLTFDDGMLGASAGCNSLSTPYEVVDGRLITPGGGMTTTDMGCDPPRHAQDDWLGGLLQDTPRIDLDGDALILTTADATVRLLDREVADPDRPLLETRWRVDTVIHGDAASSVPEDDPVVLTFHDDETLTATSAGCTSARVDVEVGIDQGVGTLRFGDVLVDAIGCPSPWAETLDVLRAGDATYAVAADRLTITADDVGIAAAADR